uniref:Histone-lysine N-methyltransferase n=2 Tax=Clastoptera arizonana TaxID=38151 RepID=A0A1B6ECU3_9HEMI
MSLNTLTENDVDDIQDSDGSVSSNSDSEKVDNGLIKKILSEMKSEFNRGTSVSTTDTVEKFDSSDETIPIDDKNDVKVDIQKLIEQNLNSIESCEDNQTCDDNSSTPLSEPSSEVISTSHIIINNTVYEPQECRDEEKPRIILTLRTSEEDRDISIRTEKKSNISSNRSYEESYKDTSVTNQPKIENNSTNALVKESIMECKTRRSLRNQNLSKDENDGEVTSKRSSRRFSKENGRESVLQNAIARKEKSFSALNQSEERSYRRGARSPRHNHLSDSKSTKLTNRTKSPKTQNINIAKQVECNTSEINGIETSSNNKELKSEFDSLGNQLNISLDIKNCDTSEKHGDIKTSSLINPKDNPNLFTKTGKRRPRYRYFKGLKYSLSGSSVKKKPIKLGKKKQNSEMIDSSNIASDHSIEQSSTPEVFSSDQIHTTALQEAQSYEISSHYETNLKKGSAAAVNSNSITKSSREVDDTVEIKQEVDEHLGIMETTDQECVHDNKTIKLQQQFNILGIKLEQSQTQAPMQVGDDLSGTEEEDCREINFTSSEYQGVQVGIKRKLIALNEDEYLRDDNIQSRVESPSVGEVDIEPNIPNQSSISHVGFADFCSCKNQTDLYPSTTNFHNELYCQATDSFDSRIIGCCNTVDKHNTCFGRPSNRVPFLLFCAVHHHRLRQHNCCPGCGLFCSQGKFMTCELNHHYHEDCQLVEDGKTMCPHCGSETGTRINISFGPHKCPVLLPLQKPPKSIPSAKMTLGGCKFLQTGVEDEKFSSSLPLIPASALILPSGLHITSQGLPQSLDKDKLDHLLHVACNIQPDPLQRYTLRNMYQAAKSGDAERMIHMLASGLNPNHIFREWLMGSALHAACAGGHLSVVHLLLQAGANTDVLDRDQNTPLMLACNNGHNDVVKYLVKAGASVTLKGGDGMTALHLAAKAGNLEACYYLISNPNVPRTFIDTVDDGRWTPLVWAAEHHHTDVVKFLLDKRADPLVRDSEQNIALHWAALAGSVDISEALLNYGSDINSTNANADTPLHIAARQNVYECVLLLLARGARVDLHNRAGFLPIDCCMVNPSETYTAIKLNVELRALMLNVQKQSMRILTNDITRGHEANPIQCVNAVDDESEPEDFVYIVENCFTSNINIDRTISSLQSCKCRDVCSSGSCLCGKVSIRCWYDDEGKLLPEFNFADPPMLFECNQACLCNRLTCKNRVVQHGITARFQLFRTKGNKGWGVSTLRVIPKGSYVCEYIGEIISDCEADTREDDSYLFDLDNRDGETYCIDARRYGNIARFINHNCVPNLLPVRVFINHQDLHFPRIAFFANRDIEANEELGFDYGAKFWIIKYKLFTCTCGAENCRYSEKTISQTLANYNNRLKLELDQTH